MVNKQLVADIFHCKKYNNISALVSQLHSLLYRDLQISSPVDSEIVDSEFLKEVRTLSSHTDVLVHFGPSLRDLKCVITDETHFRDHTIFIRYEGPKELSITDAAIPHSDLQDKTYESIKYIVTAFKEHIDGLSGYFYELDRIDQICTVMEPTKASFRDNFRRILLDERTWLHVEVTPKGFAANIHLLGNSEKWQDKLQTGLLRWDHDKDIVDNIMTIFDIVDFPVPCKSPTPLEETIESPDKAVCNICLCSELPDIPGVPQPLCQNPQCVVYFHRNCLFQWLVACSGGRPPVFGVATGSCPTCLQPTTCSEKDA